MIVYLYCISLNTQRQVLTTQADGSYSTGPTLVNYRFNYHNATEQVSDFVV